MDEARVRQMIAVAIEAERERVASVVETAEVLGDYSWGDSFVPDIRRSLRVLADRIRSPTSGPGE